MSSRASTAHSVTTATVAPRPVGRPRGKTRDRARFDERRQEVLLAAARVFNEKGFHNATLDDVAEELGVTKPAIYYYAQSKDELLFACGSLALDALTRALDTSRRQGKSGRERLVSFFHVYGELIVQDFGRCLATSEPRDLQPRSRRATIARRRTLNLAVRGMLADGVKDGSLRKCDDRAVSIALFDAFNGLARWFDHKGPTPLAKVIDSYLSAFVSGLEPAD